MHTLLQKFVETKMFASLPPMLDEDVQLRPFQSLKVDRNHLKLNLNQLTPLNKLESVGHIDMASNGFSHFIR